MPVKDLLLGPQAIKSFILLFTAISNSFFASADDDGIDLIFSQYTLSRPEVQRLPINITRTEFCACGFSLNKGGVVINGYHHRHCFHCY
jgi:hypothetical protein